MKDVETSEEIPAGCYLSTELCLYISNAPAEKGRIVYCSADQEKRQRGYCASPDAVRKNEAHCRAILTTPQIYNFFSNSDHRCVMKPEYFCIFAL